MLLTVLGVLGAVIIIPQVILILAAFNRRKSYPEKSFLNCYVECLLGPLRYFRLWRFKEGRVTLDKAIKYAMKKTKLNDFGGMDFVKNYAMVLDSKVHQSLKLTNVGYLMYQLELNQTLIRRLKFVDYLKKNDTVVSKIPVRSPVFVMGLPRTGTTFLHRLLSLDPQVRSPLLWELLSPVPTVAGNSSQEVMNKDREKRARIIRSLIQQRDKIGDDALKHIHEIGADLPEECLMSLTMEYPLHLSCLYSIYFVQEQFFSKENSPKVVETFAQYKKVLQTLSQQIGEVENPRRWMLKCPIHLYYIKEIKEVYPDAKFIWTHRHPVSAVPSMCSLVKSLHQVYYHNECREDAKLGRHVTDLTAHTLKQSQIDLKESNAECSHVLYNNIIADPIATVKAIYEQFNWTFSKEYEQILKQFLQDDKEKRERIKKEKVNKKESLHTYSPEEFSITYEELVTGPFAEYCETFNVPMSKN